MNVPNKSLRTETTQGDLMPDDTRIRKGRFQFLVGIIQQSLLPILIPSFAPYHQNNPHRKIWTNSSWISLAEQPMMPNSGRTATNIRKHKKP